MNTFCLIVLVVSFSFLLLSIIASFLMQRSKYKSIRDIAVKKSYVLTPFQTFLIGFFISTLILFIPIYIFIYFDNELGFINIFKSVVMSVHNTMRLFVLDGDFDIVKNSITTENVGELLSKVYSIYFVLFFIVAPILTASFFLSFLKNINASIRCFFYPKSDIYVMSELNERSISLAEDILTNKMINGKKLVIFADVFEKDEEENYELVEQAKRLGAICFKKDVLEIGLRPLKKNVFRKFFFIGDNEDENLKQALTLISSCRNNAKYNTPKTCFYVFSNSVESEVLLNTTDNGLMRVRRLCQARSLALYILRNYSIFDTSYVKEGKKLISIVIVGLGEYGLELLKAIIWCGQMDGYLLQIHVFDKEKEVDTIIEGFAPELKKLNGIQTDGEPFYDVSFHSEMDVNKKSFLDELSDIEYISSVFVSLGDDELNIETAVKIRMQLGREQINNQKPIPAIYPIVYSSVKNDVIEKDRGLKDIKGNDYGISFIGSLKERYTLSFIEQKELEEDSLKFHLEWAKTEKQVEESKASYEKYEYYRTSSISKALHVYYREKLGLIDGMSDNADKILEHKRWNAFMRAEGYVYAETKNDIAKTHYDLVPFDKLRKQEMEKDKVVSVYKDKNKNVTELK